MSVQDSTNALVAGARLLVVDRCALVCEGLVALFRGGQGFAEVIGATSLDQATRLAQSIQPDVVLLDPVLLDAGTAPVAQRLASAWPSAKLVLLDEMVSPLHLRVAVETGAWGYWTKQATFEQLAAALRQVAAGRPAFSPEVRRYLLLTPSGLRLRPLPEGSLFLQLTLREWQVLRCLSEGLTVKQSARQLGLSASTVDNHKSRLMRKLKVHKVVDLVRLAIAEGVLRPHWGAMGQQIGCPHSRPSGPDAP